MKKSTRSVSYRRGHPWLAGSQTQVTVTDKDDRVWSVAFSIFCILNRIHKNIEPQI